MPCGPRFVGAFGRTTSSTAFTCASSRISNWKQRFPPEGSTYPRASQVAVCDAQTAMISHISRKAVFGGKLASNGSGQVGTLLAKHTKRLVRFAVRRLDAVVPTG